MQKDHFLELENILATFIVAETGFSAALQTSCQIQKFHFLSPSATLCARRGLQTMPIQSRRYIALDCYFKPRSKVFLCGNLPGPMDQTKISSDDKVKEFSHFRSPSPHFMLGFQYVRVETTNHNEMPLSVWLSRQLRYKSDEIHRLCRQIRAYQMNLQRANQKVASLVKQLGEALKSVSEIDLIPFP
jgi:hypothetical protein